MNPQTVYELIQLLENYHQQRRATYQRLARDASEERAGMLLAHLADLEAGMLRIIHREQEQLRPQQSTFLSSGPTLSVDPAHAADCRCDSEPSFAEALQCALASDQAVLELIDRLAGSSAAASIQDLAVRLRELEQNKDREIARFTRQD